MSMQDTNNYNRNHKDSLFRFIFNDKGSALSLYNAINDSDYNESDTIEFYTMNDFLYMGMKNDLSFLLDWNLNMFEHQSTYNPSKFLSIPIPRYYVFYNGLKKAEDEIILRLTDSMHGTNASEFSSAEFTAHMININAGHSANIMQRCPLLHQYSLFVAALREKISKGLTLDEAINTTVTECIAEGILANILREHRAEVTDMLFKEYDSATHIASEKEISYEEGLQAGLQQSEQAIAEERERADSFKAEALILSYFAQGKSTNEIATLCNLSIDSITNILKKYNL